MLLVLICLSIIAGVYTKQLVFAMILAAVLILIAIVAKPAGAPAHAGSARGPLVQPIIIRRKYAGPASIYPEKMTIIEAGEHPGEWAEYSQKGVGNFVWRGIGKLKNLLSDEDE